MRVAEADRPLEYGLTREDRQSLSLIGGGGDNGGHQEV